MELRPYYDRPTAVISDYLARIDQKCEQTTPIGATKTRVFGPKANTERVSSALTNFPFWGLLANG